MASTDSSGSNKPVQVTLNIANADGGTNKVHVSVSCRCTSADQYPMYKMQLEAQLDVYDLETALTDDKHAQTKAVKNIILSTIAPELQVMVADQTAYPTAKSVIAKLDKLFGTEAKGTAALYLRKLQDIKMEKGETIMQFYARFYTIVEILKIGKQPPSDFAQVQLFLNALPQEYGNVKDNLEGDSNITSVEECLQRLVPKQTALTTASPGGTSGSAFPFQKRPHHGKPSTQFNKGKPNGSQPNGNQPNGNQPNGNNSNNGKPNGNQSKMPKMLPHHTFNGYCANCKHFGHSISECRKLQKERGQLHAFFDEHADELQQYFAPSSSPSQMTASLAVAMHSCTRHVHQSAQRITQLCSSSSSSCPTLMLSAVACPSATCCHTQIWAASIPTWSHSCAVSSLTCTTTLTASTPATLPASSTLSHSRVCSTHQLAQLSSRSTAPQA